MFNMDFPSHHIGPPTQPIQTGFCLCFLCCSLDIFSKRRKINIKKKAENDGKILFRPLQAKAFFFFFSFLSGCMCCCCGAVPLSVILKEKNVSVGTVFPIRLLSPLASTLPVDLFSQWPVYAMEWGEKVILFLSVQFDLLHLTQSPSHRKFTKPATDWTKKSM